MEFLVLRRKRLREMPIPFGRRGQTGGDVEAVVEDLSPQDVRRLHRDATVEAYAPPMPLTLIEPQVVNSEPISCSSET